MGVDGDLTSIMRDIVEFLESLCAVELPGKMENTRANLLQRTKRKLVSLGRVSASPEPYIDMNAAGKALLMFANKSREVEEYVAADEPPRESNQQDYYETFQEIKSQKNCVLSAAKNLKKDDWTEQETDQELVDVYKHFTAAKTMSEATKSGAIYQKIDRKAFGFVRGNLRLCWIGLVKRHLLIYASEDDRLTPEICSLRGYTARAAPNAVSRDPERAKSAFELVCPGNKTLQFVAKSPTEMSEWLTAISESAEKIDDEVKLKEEKLAESIEERYQDVGPISGANRKSLTLEICLRRKCVAEESKNDDKDEKIEEEKKIESKKNCSEEKDRKIATPRRLPSLPSEETPSYEALDDEDDDIYHKIEDYRETEVTRYENVKKSRQLLKMKKFSGKKKRKRDKEKSDASAIGKKEEKLEIYDDVRSHDPNEKPHGPEVAEEKNLEILSNSSSNYDDIGSISLKPIEPTKKSISSKRSFLDRVRKKKDAVKEDKKSGSKEKKEKKSACQKSKSEKIDDADRETYDDVSQLPTDVSVLQLEDSKIPENNYNCPPPPRPIAANISEIAKKSAENQAVYDDVDCRRNENIPDGKSMEIMERMGNSREETRIPDGEHYQVPRAEAIRAIVQGSDELYDDIALLADFRAKKRCSNGSLDETGKSISSGSSNGTKKAWNRFGSRKKISRDVSTGESTIGNDPATVLDDCKLETGKVNRLHKLFNKMESGLGKNPSPKSVA